MLWSGEIKPRVSLALDVVMKSGLNKKNINAASNYRYNSCSCDLNKGLKKIQACIGIPCLDDYYRTGAALLNRNELSQLRRG